MPWSAGYITNMFESEFSPHTTPNFPVRRMFGRDPGDCTEVKFFSAAAIDGWSVIACRRVPDGLTDACIAATRQSMLRVVRRRKDLPPYATKMRGSILLLGKEVGRGYDVLD
jgi:hypothetical protein